MGLTWDALSAISTATATTIVVVATLIGLRQVREAFFARHREEVREVIDQFQSNSTHTLPTFLSLHKEEIAEILRERNFAHKLDVFFKERSREEPAPTSYNELRNALGGLELIGVLSLHGRIPPDFERVYVAPTVVWYWQSVEPVVRRIRQAGTTHWLGDQDFYLQHFEALARLARQGELHKRTSGRSKRRELARLSARVESAIAALNAEMLASSTAAPERSAALGTNLGTAGTS